MSDRSGSHLALCPAVDQTEACNAEWQSASEVFFDNYISARLNTTISEAAVPKDG